MTSRAQGAFAVVAVLLLSSAAVADADRAGQYPAQVPAVPELDVSPVDQPATVLVASADTGVNLRGWLERTAESQIVGDMTITQLKRYFLALTGGNLTGNLGFGGGACVFSYSGGTLSITGCTVSQTQTNQLIQSNGSSGGIGFSAPNGGYVSGVAAAAAFKATGTGWVQTGSVAAASLPTCGGTNPGALEFDSTNLVYRWCDGNLNLWRTIQAVNKWGGYYDGLTTTANLTVQQVGDQMPVTTGGTINMMITRAGSDAAHNFTVRAFDTINSTVLCVTSATLCNHAVGNVSATCSAATPALGTQVALQVDMSACTGTIPTGNVFLVHP